MSKKERTLLLEKVPMKALIDNLKKTVHGFRHIVEVGDKIVDDGKMDVYLLSRKLLKDDGYQLRMLATYLLGQLSIDNAKALKLLETTIARDDDWRVQEMLAKAFDYHCKAIGYEKALPLIDKWSTAPDRNVRRAVIEGLRIWTSRPFFKTNPGIAVSLISPNKADDSEYLRKSVGNALRDISKKHPELIRHELSTWDLTDKKTKFTYSLATRH